MAIGLPCPAGIEPTGNVVKQRAEFTVETISAGQGDVSVYVEDPEGHREEVSGAAGGGLPWAWGAGRGVMGLAVGLVGWRLGCGAGGEVGGLGLGWGASCEVMGLAVRLGSWM